MECLKEKNLQDCACEKASCIRSGICCECISYHKQKGSFPACVRKMIL